MADNQDETHPVREGPGPDSRGLEPATNTASQPQRREPGCSPSGLISGVLSVKSQMSQLTPQAEERPPPYVPPAEADIRALMRPHVRPERRRGEGVSDDGFEEVELSVATTEGDSIKTESTAPPPYTSRPHSIQTMVD
ncbi:hypothetical protein KEM54_006904 [Ascosphaera aggregata]|nr:hypothetical protein KEM54_006904 [Ascosphaera aggregata]